MEQLLLGVSFYKQETIESDPKYKTIKENTWNKKQIKHNAKLNCISKTEWDPTTDTRMDPKHYTMKNQTVKLIIPRLNNGENIAIFKDLLKKQGKGRS